MFKLKDLERLKYFLGIEVASPMEENLSLSKDNEGYISEPWLYRKLVDRLILTITWPDLVYPVHILIPFVEKPSTSHVEAIHRVLHYIKSTRRQGLFFFTKSPIQSNAFCDTDWTRCCGTRLLFTRYCVFLGKPRNKPPFSRSSAEVEYQSITATCCEIICLKSILHDLDFDICIQ